MRLLSRAEPWKGERESPMYEERVKDLSRDVYSALSRYVAIHDEFFKISVRRTIPIPWLFEAIDLDRHCVDIAGIRATLERIRAEAHRLRDRVDEPLKDYLNTLLSYVDALLAAIKLFERLIATLKRKLEGSGYTMISYWRDVKAYRRSTDKYVQLGDAMNAKWQALVGPGEKKMTNSEIANELAKTVKTFCTPAQKLFFDRYTQPIILAILSDIDASLPDAERREIILECVEKEIERRVQSNDPDGIATMWHIANL